MRFFGTTHFQAGTWVGVELDQALGKNDGLVQGERYFQTQPNHGLFIRPGRLTLEQARPPLRFPVLCLALLTGSG